MKQPLARYVVECYDHKIEDKVDRFVSVAVFAVSETEALEKAATRIQRMNYVVKEVTEFFYDDRLDCSCDKCKE